MSTSDSESLGTWLCRAALAVMGLAMVVAAVCTVTISRTLWTGGAGADVEAYGGALGLHGVLLAGALSPAGAMAVIVPLVVGAGPRGRVAPLVLAALGGVAWVASWVIPAATFDAAWTFHAEPAIWPSVGAWSRVVALALLGAALAIAVVAERRTMPATRSLTTAAWAITAWVAATFTAIAIAENHHMAASLVDRLNGDTLFWGLLVAVALAALAMSMLEDMRVPSPAIAFVALGVVPALLGERVLGRLAGVVGIDVYLHDTYFEVGRQHLVMAASPAAMLAALHMFDVRVFGRRARAWLAWPGGVMLCGGSIGMAVAMFMLGARGMPRRYPIYPAEFVDAHQLVQIFGVVAGTGAALVVAAWVLGTRRATPA